MARIKIKVCFIESSINDMYEIIKKELKRIKKRQNRFLNIYSSYVMNDYNKGRWFDFCKIDKKIAKWSLSNWNNRKKFEKYNNHIDIYSRIIGKLIDTGNSLVLILEACNYASRINKEENKVQSEYINLDSTECVEIGKAEALCREITNGIKIIKNRR